MKETCMPTEMVNAPVTNLYRLVISGVEADSEGEAVEEYRQILWDMCNDPEDIRLSMEIETDTIEQSVKLITDAFSALTIGLLGNDQSANHYVSEDDIRRWLEKRGETCPAE
jgi:hypothetical protein